MVDNIITLFSSSSTTFTSNGDGRLKSAISCIVTEEVNGIFELELEYPIIGIHYSDIALRKIIYVKSNPYSKPQPFRIYAISKPIDGIVTVNAQHISYDLSGYPVSPFTANGVQNVLLNVKSSSIINCPFVFTTSKADIGDLSIVKPTSIRSILGNEVLGTYGGEYEFDNFSVKLHANRGQNRGVSIRYGKNLTDLRQEENCASVFTGVYPFWYSERDGLAQLPEKILNASGTYDFVRIYSLDLSQKWSKKPTEEQIRTEATSFMTNSNIGIPTVSLEVSFELLSQSEEYKKFSVLENVDLCDYVTVEFVELGVKATAKCIKTIYNVLTNKYDKIELGDAVSSLSSTISSQSNTIKDLSNNVVQVKSDYQKAIDEATSLITGSKGGNVVMSQDINGHPYEILIMDTTDVNTAINVWRWNSGGFGYSSNGYNGPYETAITMDGHIVASFITALTISGEMIQAGIIQSKTGKWQLNLDGETFSLGTKLTFDGTNLTFGSGVSLSWGSVDGKPTFSSVATSGSYTDLAGKPNLASVALSGNYNDLTSKPTLPTIPAYITSTYIDSVEIKSPTIIGNNFAVQTYLDLQPLSLDYATKSATLRFWTGVSNHIDLQASNQGAYWAIASTAEIRCPSLVTTGNVAVGGYLSATGNISTGYTVSCGNLSIGTGTCTWNGETIATEYWVSHQGYATPSYLSSNYSPTSHSHTYFGSALTFGSINNAITCTYVGSTGNMAANGTLSAGGVTVVSGGTKYCAQDTENYGTVGISAYETAEYYFGDIGFGVLNENGECTVYVDEVFQECVNVNIPYHVFTQVYNGAITSIDRQIEYFTVYGTPNTEFSWELKAKRLGFEAYRLEQILE